MTCKLEFLDFGSCCFLWGFVVIGCCWGCLFFFLFFFFFFGGGGGGGGRRWVVCLIFSNLFKRLFSSSIFTVIDLED